MKAGMMKTQKDMTDCMNKLKLDNVDQLMNAIIKNAQKERLFTLSMQDRLSVFDLMEKFALNIKIKSKSFARNNFFCKSAFSAPLALFATGLICGQIYQLQTNPTTVQ